MLYISSIHTTYTSVRRKRTEAILNKTSNLNEGQTKFNLPRPPGVTDITESQWARWDKKSGQATPPHLSKPTNESKISALQSHVPGNYLLFESWLVEARSCNLAQMFGVFLLKHLLTWGSVSSRVCAAVPDWSLSALLPNPIKSCFVKPFVSAWVVLEPWTHNMSISSR